MDVFSVTNKQVVQTKQPNVDTSMQAGKPIEQTHESTKAQKSQVTDKNDIKLQLKTTVKHLNEHMSSLDTNVVFGFNDKIDTMFVDVIEKSTGKIIRTIPTKEAMKLSEQMKEIVGIIFDKKG